MDIWPLRNSSSTPGESARQSRIYLEENLSPGHGHAATFALPSAEGERVKSPVAVAASNGVTRENRRPFQRVERG